MIKKYDVGVIGAGLVGCAAAFELAERGHSVIVFDQAEINRGASGRNAGSLHFQIEPRMIDVLMSEPDRLAQLIPVNVQAIEDWRGLPARLGQEIEVAMQGGLMVAETEAQRAVLERKLDLEIKGGLSVRIIEGRELRSAAPYLNSQIRWAAFCPDEGHANPRLVTPAYAAAARQRGVCFALGAEVRRLEPRADGWRIETAPTGQGARRHTAEATITEVATVLIAAGAWSRELLEPLGVDIPLKAVGLSMNVTDRTRPLIGHLIQHMGRRLSIKQLEAGNILIGGGWPSSLASESRLGPEPDTQLRQTSMIGNTAVALHTVPGIRHLNLIRSWTGIACIAPDHLPVLGPIAALPGMFIAAGGSSFTLGPTYARLISEMICGKTTSLPTGLYRPERFTTH